MGMLTQLSKISNLKVVSQLDLHLTFNSNDKWSHISRLNYPICTSMVYNHWKNATNAWNVWRVPNSLSQWNQAAFSVQPITRSVTAVSRLSCAEIQKSTINLADTKSKQLVDWWKGLKGCDFPIAKNLLNLAWEALVDGSTLCNYSIDAFLAQLFIGLYIISYSTLMLTHLLIYSWGNISIHNLNLQIT